MILRCPSVLKHETQAIVWKCQFFHSCKSLNIFTNQSIKLQLTKRNVSLCFFVLKVNPTMRPTDSCCTVCYCWVQVTTIFIWWYLTNVNDCVLTSATGTTTRICWVRQLCNTLGSKKYQLASIGTYNGTAGKWQNCFIVTYYIAMLLYRNKIPEHKFILYYRNTAALCLSGLA